MFETIELKNTIGDLLDSQTERYGDREALVHVEAGTRLTYREFKAESVSYTHLRAHET